MEHHTYDYLLCLYVKQWPKFCKEWTKRRHSSKWLKRKERKHLLSTADCYLVPVGRRICEGNEFEWRFSFTKVEEKITSNFNVTQVYCIILLKILLKEHDNCSFCKDLLCSYFLKTLMFWTLEWDQDLQWQNSDLICGMQRILARLYCGVFAGCIPHFFLPDYNLLEGQARSSTQQVSIPPVFSKYVYQNF